MFTIKKITSLCFMVCCAVILANITATANQQTEYKQIRFTDYANSNGTLDIDKYIQSDIRSSNTLMFLETKPAEIICNSNGMCYELQMTALENGETSYISMENTCELSLKNNEIIPPVFYFEEKNDKETVIPLAGESELLMIEVSDSTKKFPNANQGVLVEFSTHNPDSLPYNMVLISGGKSYTEHTMSYYFDNNLNP